MGGGSGFANRGLCRAPQEAPGRRRSRARGPLASCGRGSRARGGGHLCLGDGAGSRRFPCICFLAIPRASRAGGGERLVPWDQSGVCWLGKSPTSGCPKCPLDPQTRSSDTTASAGCSGHRAVSRERAPGPCRDPPSPLPASQPPGRPAQLSGEQEGARSSPSAPLSRGQRLALAPPGIGAPGTG